MLDRRLRRLEDADQESVIKEVMVRLAAKMGLNPAEVLAEAREIERDAVTWFDMLATWA